MTTCHDPASSPYRPMRVRPVHDLLVARRRFYFAHHHRLSCRSPNNTFPHPHDHGPLCLTPKITPATLLCLVTQWASDPLPLLSARSNRREINDPHDAVRPALDNASCARQNMSRTSMCNDQCITINRPAKVCPHGWVAWNKAVCLCCRPISTRQPRV